MFCPSCGAEYTIDLRYCNRCGANLTSIAEDSDPPVINLTKPTLIIGIVLGLVTLVGFAAIVSGAIDLSHNPQLGPEPVIVLLALGLVTLLTTDVLLVRLLFKLVDASIKSGGQKKKTKKSMPAPVQPSQLPRPITSQLTPAASVTENTTRFFEPVYRGPVEGEDPSQPKN